MLSHPLVKCSKTLAPSASAAPLDVLKTKSVLKSLGHYDAPEWGLSPYPDPALFKAIADFQRANGLKADGVMKPDGETEAALSQALTPRYTNTALRETAQALQAMGRGGDEILAHITPEEAQLLHIITDGGSINPQTGLMEFWHDYESEAAGVEGKNSGPDRSYDSGSDDYDYHDDDLGDWSPGTPSDNDGFGDTGGNDGSDKAGSANTDGQNGSAKDAQTEEGTPSKTVGRNNQVHSGNAVDNSFTGHMLDAKNLEDDDEEDNPPGYNEDETIEDVERQFQRELGINPDGTKVNKTAPAPVLDWGPQNPYWSPSLRTVTPPPPSTPSGGPRRWGNGPKVVDPQEPGAPKDPSSPKRTQNPERVVSQIREVMRNLGLVAEILGEVGRVSPMMTLPGFEDALDKEYYLEEDDPA